MNTRKNRASATACSSLRKGESGFSLIEIMIVIIILGLLVNLGVGQFGGIKEDAERTKMRKDADTIARKAQEFYTLNGKAPSSLADLKLTGAMRTPIGTDYKIADPFIYCEYPRGSKYFVPFRSIGKLLLVDNQNHIRIATEVGSRGTDTGRVVDKDFRPRLSPNGLKICAVESGDKLVIFDISAFDLSAPNTNDIVAVYPPNSQKGVHPSWISDTHVVFAAQDGTDYFVFSFDSDSGEAPSKLFKIGKMEPTAMHASADSGVIALYNPGISPPGIELYTISGDYINCFENVDDDLFSMSLDGSRICLVK